MEARNLPLKRSRASTENADSEGGPVFLEPYLYRRVLSCTATRRPYTVDYLPCSYWGTTDTSVSPGLRTQAS